MEERRRIGQNDILPLAVKQRHIDGAILFTGLQADLPSGNDGRIFYFALDTLRLYIYTGTAWKYVVLS